MPITLWLGKANEGLARARHRRLITLSKARTRLGAYQAEGMYRWRVWRLKRRFILK